MTDFAQRGPIGQKAPKQPRKARKPIPRQSAKRKAYMASQVRADGLAHMGEVKLLPCVCCNAPPPSYAHHVTGDGMPRDDMRVLPLCYACHQGPDGYHNAKASWVEKHGADFTLLPRVDAMLRR